jgi:hypothetical protein
MSIIFDAEQSPPSVLTLKTCSDIDFQYCCTFNAQGAGVQLFPQAFSLRVLGEISSDFWKLGVHIVRREEVTCLLAKLHHF